MAHYAKVIDGIVTKVIVADANFISSLVENEPGNWVKTSYNMFGGVYYDPTTKEPVDNQSVINGDEARERKNFAGIGFSYDGTGFYAPQPFNSWTLNSSTYLWEAPVAYPTDGGPYSWNEEDQTWDAVE